MPWPTPLTPQPSESSFTQLNGLYVTKPTLISFDGPFATATLPVSSLPVVLVLPVSLVVSFVPFSSLSVTPVEAGGYSPPLAS